MSYKPLTFLTNIKYFYLYIILFLRVKIRKYLSEMSDTPKRSDTQLITSDISKFIDMSEVSDMSENMFKHILLNN